MATEIIYGTPVRFTMGPLGLVANAEETKFVDRTVSNGDEGTYIGPHPHIDGWSLVAVDEDLICPCHSSHFEAIS